MYDRTINIYLDRIQQCSQIILNFKKGNGVVPAELYALMKEAQDDLQREIDRVHAYNEKRKAEMEASLKILEEKQRNKIDEDIAATDKEMAKGRLDAMIKEKGGGTI